MYYIMGRREYISGKGKLSLTLPDGVRVQWSVSRSVSFSVSIGRVAWCVLVCNHYLALATTDISQREC